jgi:MerR family redox-sensitive transcriptional activator SoxR
MINAQGLSIGDLADRTGLAVSAIRFYESKGLIHPLRNSGGQRRFDRSDIRRLSFIMIAQKMGFTLARIRDVLAPLPDNKAPTKADWTRISRQFKDELDERIATLNAMREKLAAAACH